MPRSRVERRARARAAAKEVLAFRREMDARGLTDRIARVNAAVDPGAGFFWRALKGRIAAREFLAPIRDIETVRSIAVSILDAEGVDLAGIVLKVEWRPPVMWIEAQAEQALAVEIVETVRARAAG